MNDVTINLYLQTSPVLDYSWKTPLGCFDRKGKSVLACLAVEFIPTPVYVSQPERLAEDGPVGLGLLAGEAEIAHHRGGGQARHVSAQGYMALLSTAPRTGVAGEVGEDLPDLD